MSLDITPEEHAALVRRIDCPVTWCDGRWMDHGGDGAEPENWYHAGDFALQHGARVGPHREGTGPIVWSFALARHEVMVTDDLREVVQMLRAVADEVEQIAASA